MAGGTRGSPRGRQKFVGLWLLETEVERIDGLAEAEGLDRTSYFHAALHERIHREPVFDASERELLRDLYEQLRRAGINLMQLLRDTRGPGRSQPHIRDFEDTLANLRREIEAIRKALRRGVPLP